MKDRWDEPAMDETKEDRIEKEELRAQDRQREDPLAKRQAGQGDGMENDRREDEKSADETGGGTGSDELGEGSAVPEPEAELAVLRGQVDELQNRLLRTQADFDNYRKRTRQEKDELVSYANAKLIGELLPVLDHFALALQAADADADGGALAKGIDMVYKQLLDILGKSGVQVMNPDGEAFDPKRHEAVLSEPVEGTQPGTVVQVLRSGYTLHERVLRPAMVKISQ